MPKELLQSVAVSKETKEALQDYFNVQLTSSVDAIWSGISSTELQKNRDILNQQEYAINKLSIPDSIQAQTAYRLGEICAIAKLMVLLNEKASCVHNVEQVKKDSPLLVKCVCFIGSNVTVTGNQIIEHLEMKHRSNLSNLIARQKKYDYIHTYRVGNKAIYMLSQKGQSFFEQYTNQLTSNETTTREQAVVQVVDEIIQAIKTKKINRIKMISKLCIVNPDMKKFYMSSCFANRVDSLAKTMDQYTGVVLSSKLQEAVKVQKSKNSSLYGIDNHNLEEYVEKIPVLIEP